jgi:retinol dehydrogenase-12
MSRPVAIVTGASTGIGYCTARSLARRGYRVVIATRNPQAGSTAADRINRDLASRPVSFFAGDVAGGEALYMPLDTSSLSSVHAFADAFLAKGLPGGLSVLCLNAGIASRTRGEARLTPEGFERVFATNFLGHFLLTTKLLDTLKLTAAAAAVGAPPVRIVTLGSVTHRLVGGGAPAWHDVIAGRAPRGASYYALSKLAAIAFAAELQRRLVGTGVAAVSVNPGAVASDIWRHIPGHMACWFRPLMAAFFLTPEQGCATSVAAATAQALAGAPGGLAAPEPVYLSPYSSPAWAQAAGGWVALFFGDLIGRPAAAVEAQAPTRLSLESKVGGSLWDACESAVLKFQGL